MSCSELLEAAPTEIRCTSPELPAFANPKNGPYEIRMIGIKETCPDDEDASSINTKLIIEADIQDTPPAGVTVSRTAGLEDILDALKIVLKLGPIETVFSDASITATDIPDGKHIMVDAPGLNVLNNGAYDVLFRDLRDEIGNFADEDNDPDNGIQPLKFQLEIR